MVRILGVTDLHYRLPLYDWLLSAADDADVVSVSGDLLDIVSPVPHEAQAVVVATYLRRAAEGADVLVSSGNHDLDGPGPSGEQEAGWLHRIDVPRVHTDGSSLDLGGVRFTVAPWWDGPLTRDSVGEMLAAAAGDRPDRWIWVYHSPPAGTRLCFDGRRSFPDEALTSWVAELQPDVVMCGHIHQAPWVPEGGWFDHLGKTLVINPGKQIGRVPPHVWLDTEQATVSWYGLGESETTALW